MENPDENISRTERQDIGDADADRRTFFAAVGRFSVVTPPAITLLLPTSLTSQVIAQSGGRGDRDGRRGDNDFSPKLASNIFNGLWRRVPRRAAFDSLSHLTRIYARLYINERSRRFKDNNNKSE
jgi:hypothetical protein